MVYRFFLIGLIVIVFDSLHAQTGSYFLSHYSPPDKRIDFRSKAMVQDGQGEIYFATKAGVLEFDGLNWKVIRVPASVYTLRVHNSEVWTGGLKGFGNLTSKSRGPKTYQSISEAAGIFASEIDSSNLYLCSAEKIIVHSLNSTATDTSIDANTDTGNFLGLFKIGKDVIVRTETERLFKINEGKLIPYEFEFTNLVFTQNSSDRKSDLIGTLDNRIFIRQDNQVNELRLQQSDYLTNNILVTGVWVTPKLIALGTLRGGVLFINAETGATEQIINYASGLPDNEVFALMMDFHGGVWVAHEYGFSRIAPNLPFHSFDHYPGLQGNLLCVQTFKGNVYVGTTLGLYILKENIPETEGITSYRNRQAARASIRLNEPINHEDYSYQKISKVDSKITLLTEINGILYASGQGGVYQVSGASAKSIIPDPVHYIQLSSALNQVLVATHNKQVRTFTIQENEWQETNLFDKFSEDITYIFEDRLKNLWLCGGSDIYNVTFIEDSVDDVFKYPIQNPTLDETLGFSMGSDTYIVSSGQFKKFNGKGFVNYDSLASGGKYFASAGNFWFNDGMRWRSVNRSANAIKLEWLGVFSGLRFLSWDINNRALWVITDKNELYKFVKELADSSEKTNPLFLREIRGNEVNISQTVEIEQTQGAITFEFIQPDFVGAHATQYRYQLKGLGNEWSAWSTSNNIINFSYLPAGRYVLAVQSKDILGVESRIEQIQFKVLLPYWKRWWFYALEFVVFSFLVAGAIKLARGNSRYRILSEILAILTIIMLIQFIQSVIYSLVDINTSPVIDFFVQVSIALLVFPLEILARKGMRKISRDKDAAKQFLNDKIE
jgi:ligand-binding sensor domain-containing protein